MRILMGIAVQLQIALESMVISAILIFPTHNYKIYFCLFISSSISLLTSYGFQCTDLSPSWINIFLNIFLCNYKWNYFLIFFFLIASYKYMNVTNFGMVTLYCATLLNLLVLIAFWWSLQGFLYYIRSHHLQIVTAFLFPFLHEVFHFFFLSNCSGWELQYYVE